MRLVLFRLFFVPVVSDSCKLKKKKKKKLFVYFLFSCLEFNYEAM